MTQQRDGATPTETSASTKKGQLLMRGSGMGARHADEPSGRPCYSFGDGADGNEAALNQAREDGVEV